MPLYEYYCPEHGKIEIIKPLRDRHTAICPLCKRRINKVMSTCNWTFGWRISDRSMYEPWTPKDELVRDI